MTVLKFVSHSRYVNQLAAGQQRSQVEERRLSKGTCADVPQSPPAWTIASSSSNLDVVRKVDPDEVIRLWMEEGLNTVEIAVKVGVTHQRVNTILRERNVDRGPKRYRNNSKAPDPEVLRKLYVDERLTASAIAERLDVTRSTVNSWLVRFDIPRRQRGKASIKIPEIRELKIGDSIEVPRISTVNKQTWTTYYGMAKYAGIRVSLRSIDEKTMRLTRVE